MNSGDGEDHRERAIDRQDGRVVRVTNDPADLIARGYHRSIAVFSNGVNQLFDLVQHVTQLIGQGRAFGSGTL